MYHHYVADVVAPDDEHRRLGADDWHHGDPGAPQQVRLRFVFRLPSARH